MLDIFKNLCGSFKVILILECILLKLMVLNIELKNKKLSVQAKHILKVTNTSTFKFQIITISKK